MTPLAIALIVLVAMFLLGLPIFMSLIISSVVAILAGGDILLLHDGNAARTPTGQAVILEVLPALLHAIHSAGLTTVTLRAACTIPDTPAAPAQPQ